jgi:galactose mutarotase-like enzyme
MTASVELRSEALTAVIAPLGAELRSLRTHDGLELIWPGDAAWWARSSPLLFPVIGRLREGHVRYRGREYAMPPHGFAMHERFELVGCDGTSCRWRLGTSTRLREQYPFDFELDVVYAVRGCSLHIDATVRNAGPATMPFSFGFHPGLRWPARGAARSAHWIEFEAVENAGTRRPAVSGLLGPPGPPLPLRGLTLPLVDSLFEGGAHVLPRAVSRHAVFGDDRGEICRIGWEGMESLTLWTKPGAPFICIEPWQGLPDSDDRPRELDQRDGALRLEPDQAHSAAIGFALPR